jgi:hypothetical protein
LKKPVDFTPRPRLQPLRLGRGGENQSSAGRKSPLDPEREYRVRRIRFYAGMFALQEALFGIENGGDQALQAGLAEYT